MIGLWRMGLGTRYGERDRQTDRLERETGGRKKG